REVRAVALDGAAVTGGRTTVDGLVLDAQAVRQLLSIGEDDACEECIADLATQHAPVGDERKPSRCVGQGCEDRAVTDDLVIAVGPGELFPALRVPGSAIGHE